MSKSEVSLKLLADTRRLKARIQVATVLIKAIYWLPIPFAWKMRASDWLVAWVKRTPVASVESE